jgi:penicillin-binding protein 1C
MALTLAIVSLPVVTLLVASLFTALPAELDGAGRYSESIELVDRDGIVLREVRADDATRARWVPLDEVGDTAANALLAAEDRRFNAHAGVDPFSVVRAGASALVHRRIVSGASTITMQLARLVRPHRRNALGKLGEMALAIRIERSLSKRRVLEEYVNRAPFGPSLRGLDAASRYYFDKRPSQLSLAEAATLAAIPRGPDLYAPEKHPDLVLRRRDRVLERMFSAGFIDREARDRALAEPLAVQGTRGSFGAPHLVDALLGGRIDGALDVAAPRPARVTTTIARAVQAEAEVATLAMLKPLAKRHVTAASVVVIDNATGEVLAYVGSPDFRDAEHGGQNDGARAKRQPGSTLKPFVYGLAMESRGFTPATVLPDVALHLESASGSFTPMNYDERFHGPVRLREALANSFNVPAVWTANELGVSRVLERLRGVGFTSLDGSPEFYGPALALGDGEVTLLELTNAYATLARGGVWRPLVYVREVKTRAGTTAVTALAAPERRVMPRDVALMLADILKDKDARLASFGERSVLELPFDVAAKTGTSKGFRDNWTVGFTHEVTVGVWVGNFDGSPMQDVSGITGAGPIFRAVMEAAMRRVSSTKAEPAPIGVTEASSAFVRVEICPLSGHARTEACPHGVYEWLPRERSLPEACTMHEHVMIDRRNGLLAGPRCPRAFVEERTFEVYPPSFAAWSRGAGRELAPEGSSPLCGPGAPRVGHGELRVGYPEDGARFVLDPDRARALQQVQFRVEAPAGASEVRLRVDGRAAAQLPFPYVTSFPLAPGEHVILAEATGLGSSPPVHVIVE